MRYLRNILISFSRWNSHGTAEMCPRGWKAHLCKPSAATLSVQRKNRKYSFPTCSGSQQEEVVLWLPLAWVDHSNPELNILLHKRFTHHLKSVENLTLHFCWGIFPSYSTYPKSRPRTPHTASWAIKETEPSRPASVSIIFTKYQIPKRDLLYFLCFFGKKKWKWDMLWRKAVNLEKNSNLIL